MCVMRVDVVLNQVKPLSRFRVHVVVSLLLEEYNKNKGELI